MAPAESHVTALHAGAVSSSALTAPAGPTIRSLWADQTGGSTAAACRIADIHRRFHSTTGAERLQAGLAAREEGRKGDSQDGSGGLWRDLFLQQLERVERGLAACLLDAGGSAQAQQHIMLEDPDGEGPVVVAASLVQDTITR